MLFTILLPFRPTSNSERQRRFRERNPGYYGRLRRRKGARLQALDPAHAAASASASARAQPLMLPAPVDMPLFPGINAIPATLEALRESAPLPLSNQYAS